MVSQVKDLFADCIHEIWSRLTFERQVVIRRDLFADPVVGHSRWLFESSGQTLADIKFEETLTTAFNQLTVQEAEGGDLGLQGESSMRMEEKFERTSFLMIHWCAFLSPQRTLTKILEEGIRNKGQQAILVGVLWHLGGLATFRYQHDMTSLLARVVQEKLALLRTSALGGPAQERNFQTVLEIIVREATRRPRFVDLDELLTECCLPHLRGPFSPLASVALALTSQIIQSSTKERHLHDGITEIFSRVLDLLDQRSEMKPEEVDLCLRVCRKILALLQHEISHQHPSISSGQFRHQACVYPL